MLKKILITGGTGFLGGHLIRQAGGNWDVFTSSRTGPIPMIGVSWEEMDLESPESIERTVLQTKPDAVIHAAAMTRVDECETERDRACRTNIEATNQLAGLCSKLNARMVFVSSDMVFDGLKGNYRESDPAHPVNFYGETKCLAEEEVMRNCPNSVCARTALIYGAPALKGTSFSDQILRHWTEGKAVHLFTDQYRSPILVQQLACALLELAESSFRGILHLGGGERIDRWHFGLELAELKGISQDLILPVKMDELSSGAKRPRDASFDSSLAKSLLRTRLDGFREGLRRAYSGPSDKL
jgi:dTDP-4-dehydrorhamnose reductase